MAKRSSASEERKILRRVAARQAAGDDSGIDLKDIPRLTDEQLASMTRHPKAKTT